VIRGLTTAAESSVVALAMTGDAAAFRELVLRRQAKVRDLQRRLCRDPSKADDLAQETFVQAWKSLPRLQSPEAFGGWLRSIAVNVWKQDVRRAGVPLEDDPSALDTVADPSPDPEANAMRMDLEAALARLRPAERLCVVLAHAEGMTHPEIVEVAGMPIGTVKSHIARGGQKLRAFLAIGDGDD
jgi:RNA polymerase sigma-70 factor (ECF subfamily)